MNLSPEEAGDLHDLLTEMNSGRPVWVLPVRVVDHADGTTSKLPKTKWNEAVSTRADVVELWDDRRGGFMGVHLSRSGLVLADQDVEVVPDDLTETLKANPTFTSLSIRRQLPHYWYRNPKPSPTARDRRWIWRGSLVGDLKGKGIGVLGEVTEPRAFSPLPEDFDTNSYFSSGASEDTRPSLRDQVTAWVNWLDEPPPLSESIAWVVWQLRALEGAQPGERNNKLYQAARDIAQVVAGGAMSPEDGVRVLLDAAWHVFTEDEMRTEVKATITSAFERERERDKEIPRS